MKISDYLEAGSTMITPSTHGQEVLLQHAFDEDGNHLDGYCGCALGAISMAVNNGHMSNYPYADILDALPELEEEMRNPVSGEWHQIDNIIDNLYEEVGWDFAQILAWLRENDL